MLQLPNNCRAGKMSVFPNNWKTAKANSNLTWRISYWFYDDVLKQKKKIVIKGMNSLETAQEKRQVTEFLINDELEQLKNGLNRITDQVAKNAHAEISAATPFLMALKEALASLKCEKKTKRDIANMLSHFGTATEKLMYDLIPICDIKKKHFKAIFVQLEKDKEKWSANLYNHYRKYLGILYNELEELEITDINIPLNLKQQKTVKRIRRTLTKSEREIVKKHLVINYPVFWRFTEIFFRSGCRIVELMNLKVKDVDLKSQTFIVLTKKGKEHREVLKVINNGCLHHWQEILKDANPNHYIFSRGLVPGENAIREDQITKRWYRLVKQKKLGIQADFYSLKHLFSTEVVSIVTHKIEQAQKAAAAINSHTSTAMVENVYDIESANRKNEDLKRISNVF